MVILSLATNNTDQFREDKEFSAIAGLNSLDPCTVIQLSRLTDTFSCQVGSDRLNALKNASEHLLKMIEVIKLPKSTAVKTIVASPMLPLRPVGESDSCDLGAA